MRCPDCFEKYGTHVEMVPVFNSMAVSCGCKQQQKCPRCGTERDM